MDPSYNRNLVDQLTDLEIVRSEEEFSSTSDRSPMQEERTILVIESLPRRLNGIQTLEAFPRLPLNEPTGSASAALASETENYEFSDPSIRGLGRRSPSVKSLEDGGRHESTGSSSAALASEIGNSEFNDTSNRGLERRSPSVDSLEDGGRHDVLTGSSSAASASETGNSESLPESQATDVIIMGITPADFINQCGSVALGLGTEYSAVPDCYQQKLEDPDHQKTPDHKNPQ